MGHRRPQGESPDGNFVSEWYGYRLFPRVASTRPALETQKAGSCPFLSDALQRTTPCIKAAPSQGVCTISSASNGPRQDWLVCPYRALGSQVFNAAAHDLFQVDPEHQATAPSLYPVPWLATVEQRARLLSMLARKRRVLVYFQDKIGGEISFPQTAYSPEISFDTMFVELRRDGEAISLGRVGIVELQTMDFHGSYRAVVKNLKDALRLHGARFHREVEKNRPWLSEQIEGPNIANVFKRTFYQMVLKFEVSRHERSAGCTFALPAAVWDSWQKHLGRPQLEPVGAIDRVLELGLARPDARQRLTIYVFDVADGRGQTPDALVVRQRIRTDPETLAHLALKTAPEKAIRETEAFTLMVKRIRQRLLGWWPDMPLAPDS